MDEVGQNLAAQDVVLEARAYTPGRDENRIVQMAADFIEEQAALHPDAPVALYGYSRGGEALPELTQELANRGIVVDLYVAVDAAYGPLSGSMQVPENVVEAYNYYQTTPSGIRSRGYPATTASPDTVLHNMDRTGPGITHGTLPIAIRDEVINLMTGHLLPQTPAGR